MKILLASLFTGASIAQAQSQPALPQVVEAAIAENKKQCDEGSVELLPGFVTTKYINGDGKPDYIVNYEHFQCGEFMTLFCGTGGCLTEVFASLEEGDTSPPGTRVRAASALRSLRPRRRRALRHDAVLEWQEISSGQLRLCSMHRQSCSKL